MKKSISGKIDQLLEKEELKNITFSSEDASFPQKIKNNFLILLTELAETVALVIEGYFDNPYEEMDKVQEG